ncbi:lysosome-associated membrane glycoprotein 2 isoform 3-T3 [Rhinophrynus dorsalis]
MDRCVLSVALCLLISGLMQSSAFEVEIKDDSNVTCLYAKLMVNFTIQYETNTSVSKNVTFEAPSAVTTNGSHCGSDDKAPLLLVHFGDNLSWSLNFTRNDTIYSGSVLTVTYNTNDTGLFPDGQKRGFLTSTTQFFTPIPLNTTYKCIHSEVISAVNVTLLLWNVTLQAFVQNGTYGKEFICDADKPSPVPSTTPSTPNTTTPAPTSKPVDKPTAGNYSVSNKTGKCLLAYMGLQINASLLVKDQKTWVLFNINPNITNSTGSCSNESATLRLTESGTTIEFSFAIKKKNFYLQEVNVTLINGSGSSSSLNQNLSFWEASLGSSYMCRKEQIITVSDDLHINAFDVRVQPFDVHETFDTAQECSLDDDSILIPIVVGASLAGLIVIIVIAYLIGRRKSYAGYQTL